MRENTEHKHSTSVSNVGTTLLPEVETEHKQHKLMLAVSATTTGALALILGLSALNFGAQPAKASDDHIKTPAFAHIIN